MIPQLGDDRSGHELVHRRHQDAPDVDVLGSHESFEEQIFRVPVQVDAVAGVRGVVQLLLLDGNVLFHLELLDI